MFISDIIESTHKKKRPRTNPTRVVKDDLITEPTSIDNKRIRLLTTTSSSTEVNSLAPKRRRNPIYKRRKTIYRPKLPKYKSTIKLHRPTIQISSTTTTTAPTTSPTSMSYTRTTQPLPIYKRPAKVNPKPIYSGISKDAKSDGNLMGFSNLWNSKVLKPKKRIVQYSHMDTIRLPEEIKTVAEETTTTPTPQITLQDKSILEETSTQETTTISTPLTEFFSTYKTFNRNKITKKPYRVYPAFNLYGTRDNAYSEKNDQFKSKPPMLEPNVAMNPILHEIVTYKAGVVYDNVNQVTASRIINHKNTFAHTTNTPTNKDSVTKSPKITTQKTTPLVSSTVLQPKDKAWIVPADKNKPSHFNPFGGWFDLGSQRYESKGHIGQTSHSKSNTTQPVDISSTTYTVSDTTATDEFISTDIPIQLVDNDELNIEKNIVDQNLDQKEYVKSSIVPVTSLKNDKTTESDIATTVPQTTLETTMKIDDVNDDLSKNNMKLSNIAHEMQDPGDITKEISIIDQSELSTFKEHETNTFLEHIIKAAPNRNTLDNDLDNSVSKKDMVLGENDNNMSDITYIEDASEINLEEPETWKPTVRHEVEFSKYRPTTSLDKHNKTTNSNLYRPSDDDTTTRNPSTSDQIHRESNLSLVEHKNDSTVYTPILFYENYKNDETNNHRLTDDETTLLKNVTRNKTHVEDKSMFDLKNRIFGSNTNTYVSDKIFPDESVNTFDDDYFDYDTSDKGICGSDGTWWSTGEDSSHCYHILDAEVNVETAVLACISIDSELASLETRDEMLAVQNMLMPSMYYIFM